jgi:hypothetical protein
MNETIRTGGIIESYMHAESRSRRDTSSGSSSSSSGNDSVDENPFVYATAINSESIGPAFFSSLNARSGSSKARTPYSSTAILASKEKW